MSNPTSNFGWQMPTPTDLVTDLPADFEVFGQAVDSDFADLLGGTTGQVLSKTSNTDMDFTWVSANPGDITEVTAGTGISGGGTSGAVTITNDMATTITASGDIVVGTGSGTYDNLPIGTTGQILTADTTVSPYKVKWATPASTTPTFVGCQLEKITSLQSISNATATAITFNSEVFDTDGFHDNTTNNTRITIPSGKAGKYLLIAQVSFAANATGARIIKLYKNGTLFQLASVTSAAPATDFTVLTGTNIVSATVGDYFELFAEQSSGGNLNLNNSAGNGVGCFFGASYQGA